MVNLEIEPSALESVPEGNFVAGINIGRFDDYLGGASGGDPVMLSFNTEKRKLNIQHTNREFDMALIDPDALRDEPDLPDLEFPVDVTLPAGDWTDAVDTCELVSDRVHFNADGSDGSVVVSASGDIDEARVTFDSETWSGDSRIDADTHAIYSIEYTDELLGAVPSGTDLRVRYNDEKPKKYNYEFADGHAHAELMCAPRIQTQ
jgi:proliferating cell nuclear antigen